MINISEAFKKKIHKPFTVKQAFEGIKNEESPVEISHNVKERWHKTKVGETLWNYNSGQVKVNPDKPSPTLTKNGSATYSMFHYDFPRPLLVSEMKRISSFPDNFLFTGGYKLNKDRIGNSVPPLLMKSIAEVIKYILYYQEVANMSKNNYLQILENAWQAHLSPRETTAPTVISTFAGCGGSSLGYSMAGFRELLAVEWDENAVETFKLNFPDVPVYHGDIAKLSVEECMKLAGLTQPGDLDVLDGSPPCQGFSSAGKREFTDDRNQLFREYVRLLRGLQPKVFVMENVSGMVKGKMKLIFAEIMRELKSTGYLVSARLLNAMYFNVPQSRERMIFIGVRPDIGKVPTHPHVQS